MAKKIIDQNKVIVHPYMIQRIEPRGKGNLRNPFGAGGPRAHFSEEAYSEITKFAQFGYMGSAQFETDASPRAFEKMRSYQLILSKIIIESRPFWILCSPELVFEVQVVIKSLLANEPKTRDPIHLSSYEDPDIKTKGWVDVSGDAYMFFTDEKLADSFYNFFTTFKGDITDPKILKNRKKYSRDPVIADLFEPDQRKFSYKLRSLLKD